MLISNIFLFFTKIKRFIILAFLFLIVLIFLPFFNKQKVSTLHIQREIEKFKFLDNKNTKAKLISDSKQSFLLRLALIFVAQESINVAYYHIDSSDKTAKIFLAALVLKAKAGIKVNIVVDTKFSGLDNETIRVLSNTENITLYYYNPLNLKDLESIQVSLHNKLLIVDNQWFLSGGRNISDYFLCENNFDFKTAYDLDVLIYSLNNPINKQFNTLYKEIIDLKYSKIKKLKINKKTLNYTNQLIDLYNNFLISEQINLNKYLNDFKKEMYFADKVSLIYSDLTPKNKQPFVAQTLFKLSQESLGDTYILTPYAIADKFIIDSLKQLTIDKDVFMLINSLASSPNYPAFSNYLLNRQKFIDTKIKIYEYNNHDLTSIHSKAYILGNNISAVGSLNLDNRSLFINSEQMLIIESMQFYNELKEICQKQIDKSQIVSNDLKTYQKQYEEKNLKLKRLLMKTVAILLKPFQNFL